MHTDYATMNESFYLNLTHCTPYSRPLLYSCRAALAAGTGLPAWSGKEREKGEFERPALSFSFALVFPARSHALFLTSCSRAEQRKNAWARPSTKYFQIIKYFPWCFCFVFTSRSVFSWH
jgi:hypothetical protein